ncbi:MAG: histidine kinase, partial [Gammaproteobacteria bacterium]
GAGFLTAQLLAQPWLGLRLAPHEGAGLHVLAVVPGGPASAALAGGETLLAIAGAARRVVLEPADRIAAPDMLGSYARAHRFYARQSAIHELLQEPTVTFELGDGRRVELRPAARTPLAALPPSHWYQLAVGSFCFLLGLGVWVFRPGSPAVFYYFVTGLGVALFVGVATLYVSRELAMPGPLLERAEKLNSLGVSLFGWAFMTTVCYFPRPLWPTQPVGLYTALLLTLLFANNYFEIPDGYTWGRNAPIAAVCVLMVMLGLWHLRRLRGRPAEHALLRWYMTTWLLGSLLFLVSYNLPLIFGLPPLIQKPWAYGLFALIYLGITVGITRYRVFELDRWIFICWIWFFGGLAVIAVDVALVGLLELGGGTALGVALVLVGWLYFPLRQWLWRRLGRRLRSPADDPVPALLDSALSAETLADIGHAWQAKLRELFRPATLRAVGQTSEAQLLDDRQRLRVPGFAATPALELTHRDHGRRLFSAEDLALAGAAQRLFARVAAAQAAHAQGVLDERSRVARDLHDDVSARLMSLVFRAERAAGQPLDAADVADAGRAALDELRMVIRGLEGQPVRLDDAISAWRAELESRCHDAGVVLQWRDAPGARPLLSARQHTNLSRILREAVSNALRHARPQRIGVCVEATPQALTLAVGNDGRPPPEDAAPGRGRHNMQQRAGEIGGQVEWRPQADGWSCLVRCIVPLPEAA